MNILAIDVGGSKVKIIMNGDYERRAAPSGPEMTAARMVATAMKLAQGWDFEVVSVGIPGPVRHGELLRNLPNLGHGWVDFDFAAAFGRPVKILNDAAMQALGGYNGGRMLFLGLGTGLGSAMILDGVVQPMELAHLPYKKGRTFEDYVGKRGLDRLGKKRWREAVLDVIVRLSTALQLDDVVLGGGNAGKLNELPASTRIGLNENAFLGGFRMWEEKT